MIQSSNAEERITKAERADLLKVVANWQHAKARKPSAAAHRPRARTATRSLENIQAQNDKRRHMTKGQRAMIAAKVGMVLNTTHGKAAKQAGTSREYVNHASIVLQYRPELADEVLRTVEPMPLNEAYAAALQEKERRESDEFKQEG